MTSYSKEKYAEISAWCEKRDVFAPPESFLPHTGLFVDGLACGFLITTSNNFGILDFYMTNPDAEAGSRRRALDEITSGLIDMSKDLGLSMLICDSKIPAIGSLAMKHGFIETGTFTHFARSL